LSNQLDELMARGAACVAGDIIFRGKSMGYLKNGVFVISDDGDAELTITEVAAVEVAPKAAKPRKKKDEVVEEQAPAAPAAPADDLDLSDLGDLGE
jgi:hypothetical protein